MKIGDIIYQTDGARIYKSTVQKIIYETESVAFDETAVGESIFLSEEDLKNSCPDLQKTIVVSNSTMDNLPFTHLMYVRKYSMFTNKNELYVYGVNTNDIFHTMGEFLYRSLEHVERIDFAVCTQEKLNLWEREGFEIKRFYNNYQEGHK